MIRIEQQGEEVETEERKKVREAVLGNVATFALLIGLIRAGNGVCFIQPDGLWVPNSLNPLVSTAAIRKFLEANYGLECKSSQITTCIFLSSSQPPTPKITVQALVHPNLTDQGLQGTGAAYLHHRHFPLHVHHLPTGRASFHYFLSLHHQVHFQGQAYQGEGSEWVWVCDDEVKVQVENEGMGWVDF
ncbi:hypothetical protein J437_LFUL008072 [Ladona fulva]|uniref:Uncharacterized protein n=1 Tax=Ladona fulva TaxID=123851 RepID=A0A8K0P2T2_LADFU|nr:hypothetical protein J437_LFUL008072 [Ladona fulva]